MPHMSALASGLKAFAILHRMPNLNLIRFVPDLCCAYLMQFVAESESNLAVNGAY